MGRKADELRLQALSKAIELQPGLTAAALAQELGWHRSSVTRALPSLEERGVLLTENARGQLGHFKKEAKK